jgi:hypothetical protein
MGGSLSSRMLLAKGEVAAQFSRAYDIMNAGSAGKRGWCARRQTSPG